MATIWQLLSYTPWFIYVLLILLINVGVKASKTQVLPLQRLFIMPVLFTGLAIHTLVTSVAFSSWNIASLVASLLVAALLGWWNASRYRIKVDKQKKLIQTPGSWSTLIIILAIFASKYYIGYQLAVHPQLLGDARFEICVVASMGICAGLFIGKLANYLLRFYRLPSTELVET